MDKVGGRTLTRGDRLQAPLVLAPAIDAASATPDLTVPVVLGDHPGIRKGRPQLVHTINGDASPSIPPIPVQQGQIVCMRIHAGRGMTTTINYAGYSTPFEMGTRSGNMLE